MKRIVVIDNDPNRLMKDVYSSSSYHNYKKPVEQRPKVDLGVYMHGKVVSEVEITSENKFMFLLQLGNGYKVLIIADKAECDMTQPILGKYVMLSNETVRHYQKPRIQFNGNKYVIHYTTKSFSTIKWGTQNGWPKKL